MLLYHPSPAIPYIVSLINWLVRVGGGGDFLEKGSIFWLLMRLCIAFLNLKLNLFCFILVFYFEKLNVFINKIISAEYHSWLTGTFHSKQVGRYEWLIRIEYHSIRYQLCISPFDPSQKRNYFNESRVYQEECWLLRHTSFKINFRVLRYHTRRLRGNRDYLNRRQELTMML